MSALFLTAFTHESAIGYVAGSRLCRNPARFTQGECDFAFLDGPFLVEEAPVLRLETASS